MSLTRQERLSIYKSLHPTLLRATVEALSLHFESKQDKSMPTIATLLSGNLKLQGVCSNYVSKFKTKLGADKSEAIQDIMQLFIIRTMIGVEYSDLTKIKAIIKASSTSVEAKVCHSVLSKISASKLYPTEELYDEVEKKDPLNQMLYALDMFNHMDAAQLAKYSVCKNIANLSVANIGKEINALQPKINTQNASVPSSNSYNSSSHNPDSYNSSFHKNNAFSETSHPGFFSERKSDALTLDELKIYPEKILSTIKRSGSLLFKKIVNKEGIAVIKNLINDNPGLANTKDIDGNTAIHIAALVDHHELFDFFVKQGLDINAVNKYGLAPLHLAISASDAVESIKELRKLGADMQVNLPVEIEFFPKTFS